MKLPTVSLSLLILSSIVSAVPAGPRNTRVTSKEPTLEAANKALKPSLTEKVTARLTLKPKPEDKQVAPIKNTNSLAVRNEDKTTFTVQKNKYIGGGRSGNVFDAINHSDPKTPTVMKESTVRAPPAKAKEAVNKENGFNERMGISAGKPVAVPFGKDQSKTYLPMKKVEGASLSSELKKGTGEGYISSHTLLNNTKAAINETNKAGITHKDAKPDNVMVTKDKGKMIDYGYDFFVVCFYSFLYSSAENTGAHTDPMTDHRLMASTLEFKK